MISIGMMSCPFPLMSKGEYLQDSVSEESISWLVQSWLPSMPKGEIVGIDDLL